MTPPDGRVLRCVPPLLDLRSRLQQHVAAAFALSHHRFSKENDMSDSRLMLHCGAREVNREQLDAVPCPPAEGRWRPVPHGTVLTYATEALADAGYAIE